VIIGAVVAILALIVAVGFVLTLGGDDNKNPDLTASDQTTTTAASQTTASPGTTALQATTTEATPSGPFVHIDGISVEGGHYKMSYTVSGFTPQLNSPPDALHVHFYLNTTTAENAGSNGTPPGDWDLTGDPSSFVTKFTTDNKGAATQMCTLVATVDHAVYTRGTTTGNCIDLPE
jgi:hypothetical protein